MTFICIFRFSFQSVGQLKTVVRALLKTETLLGSKAIRINNHISRSSPYSTLRVREREREPGLAYSLSPPLSPFLSLLLRGPKTERTVGTRMSFQLVIILKPHLTIAAFILIVYLPIITFKARNLFGKYPKFMKNLNLLFLSLWGRYFFHVHPGHRVPSCPRISRTVT